MGIDMRLHVWPDLENLLDHDGFVRFIKRLVQEELVMMPCAVLSGASDPNRIYGVGDQGYIDNCWQQVPVYIIGADKPGVTVQYKGYSLDELLPVLRQLPFGQCDLCVTFAAFNWHNEALRESFEQQGFANASVTIFALQAPRSVAIYDAYSDESEFDAEPNDGEHPIQQCFVADGTGGPETLMGTPLEPLLRETFGPDLWMECMYY